MGLPYCINKGRNGEMAVQGQIHNEARRISQWYLVPPPPSVSPVIEIADHSPEKYDKAGELY